jgi:hypothetical protein
MNTEGDISTKRDSFRFARLWLALGWMLILLVVIFSLWPKPHRHGGFSSSANLWHAAAYMILMLWFANMYNLPRQKVWLSAAFIAMGVSLECIQGISGFRTFQSVDILANGIGVLLGWALTLTPLSACLVGLDNLLSLFARRTR